MKTYFIDLDDTLFNTQAIKDAAHPIICKEIKEVSPGLREIKTWPDELRKPAERILSESIQKIELYPRMRSFLETHENLFLITFGPRERQKEKIAVLELKKYFKEILITEEDNKKEIFQDLMNKYQLEPEDVVVIGDKKEDEITIGKELGCETRLVKNGKFV